MAKKVDEVLLALGAGLERLEARMEQIENNFKTLEEHVFEELGRVKEEVQDMRMNEVVREERITNLEKTVVDACNTVKEQLARIQTSMLGGGLVVIDAQRAEVPKPKEFKGVRDAKLVENFHPPIKS